MTDQQPVMDPDFATSPESAPRPGLAEQVAASVPPRVARGRGEPLRTAAGPHAPRPAAAPPRAVTVTPDPVPPPTPVPLPAARASDRDDAGYVPVSRLGGLRHLLVALARHSLIKDGDTEAESDMEPRFERAQSRSASPDSHAAAGDAAESGTSTRLTAQPQIISPPKVMVEVEKEKEPVRPTPPRRDNRDNDEIQTLPSWRGQYRKKRYPPL